MDVPKYRSAGREFKIVKKICVECGAEFEGVKHRKICYSKKCRNAVSYRWRRDNQIEINARDRAKRASKNESEKGYIHEHIIKSTVIKKDHCNQCGNPFDAESQWAQFCPDCRKSNNKTESIINSLVFNVDNIVEELLGEGSHLMDIIEAMYPHYTNDNHQTIFDSVYITLLDKFGEEYFEN